MGGGGGLNVSGVGQLGSRARSWAMRAFPPVAMPPQKVRIEMSIVSEDARGEVDSKEVKSK